MNYMVKNKKTGAWIDVSSTCKWKMFIKIYRLGFNPTDCILKRIGDDKEFCSDKFFITVNHYYNMMGAWFDTEPRYRVCL